MSLLVQSTYELPSNNSAEDLRRTQRIHTIQTPQFSKSTPTPTPKPTIRYDK